MTLKTNALAEATKQSSNIAKKSPRDPVVKQHHLK